MNEKLIRLLICATYKAYQMSLKNFKNIEDFEEFKNPKRNDYVIEISSLSKRNFDICRIGKLLSDVSETFEDDKVEIELFDGTIQKWGNCDFIKIPDRLFNIDILKEGK